MLQYQSTQPVKQGRLSYRDILFSTNALLCYLALLDFSVHLLCANNYGYFRDELYYMAMGNTWPLAMWINRR
ncbi:hypothetical protein KDK_81210 [Dictyobacter kobayashii]|uniref:Uncharacterized protein n=1 Tax=Dictyobacter kobayashii TaxID=2014872 RepID=A0A402AYY1_9CHLR|nr:hypothetical protein KDK_81210 [Dictyobacter kobayashii]